MTGLLGGELFPHFSSTDDAFETMSLFLTKVKPLTNLDTGKVLIWSFVAGFSEKLIPNVLDRLANEAAALRGQPVAEATPPADEGQAR